MLITNFIKFLSDRQKGHFPPYIGCKVVLSFPVLDEEMHMDVHDRALFYYRLLKTGPKEVLLGDVIILI